jgi:integrase
MTNQPDPLDNLPAGDGTPREGLPPAPETVEFDFPLVSGRSREDLEAYGLNMVDDYHDFKKEVLSWLATYGKHPEKGQGLAESTLQSTHYKLEIVFRWLWEDEDAYTTDFTPDHADRFIRLLNRSDSMADSSVLHYGKAVQRLSQAIGDERDYLRRTAFKPLYQAALEYNSIKSYHSDMSSKERDRLKIFVSQRLGVPKSEVGPEQFEQANSWKEPSIIAVSLDTGLRPIEVGRTKVSWVNLQDNELNIPKGESTKNTAHWNCSIKKRTSRVLERWLEERATLDKYDGRDELWLTKQGSTYSSKSCNYLLSRLVDEGDLPIPEHKDITWYSIRHGVATYWANHIGPHHAKEQLRHKSVTTTMKYLHSDAETRNDAAEQIW